MEKTNRPDGVPESSRLSPFARHLEYLGYDVTFYAPTDAWKFERLSCKHYQLPNVSLNAFAPNFIMHRIAYTSQRLPTDKANLFINEINRKLNLVRSYYETREDGMMDFIFEAVYIGAYEKKAFAEFHEEIQRDVRRFFEKDRTEQVFSGEEPAQPKPRPSKKVNIA